MNLADIWRYRDLLFLLVHRDFVARYKQTILGPAWFILQPLMMTVVFTVIFGNIAKIPTDGLPPMLFYLTGLLGWNCFAQVLQSTSNTLVSNASLFGKVYFPRLIVPLVGRCFQFPGVGIAACDFVVRLGLFQVLNGCRRGIWIFQHDRLASAAAGTNRGA